MDRFLKWPLSGEVYFEVGNERATDPFLLTRRKGDGGASPRPDRRAQPRTSYDEKVVLWRRAERGVADRSSAWALNLSGGGIRIVLATTLAVGEHVGIGFEGRPTAVPGRVVWVSSRTDGCVAGIAFQRN